MSDEQGRRKSDSSGDGPGNGRDRRDLVVVQRHVAARPERSLTTRTAYLPVPVKRAAAAMAVGAAVQLTAGIAARYLARRAATSAAAESVRLARRPAPRTVAEPGDLEVVSETLIVRRVWARRGKQ